MEISTLSVAELNNHIKNLLDGDMLLSGVAVRGELSNYKIYPSGHHYFTLKDNDSSLRCVMFKSSASKLRFKPESGMGVTAVGRVAVFPRDGAYQLYCEELLPEGWTSVGIAMQLAHTAATPCGMHVRARAEVTAVDGRKITYRISAGDDSGEIGHGVNFRWVPCTAGGVICHLKRKVLGSGGK